MNFIFPGSPGKGDAHVSGMMILRLELMQALKILFLKLSEKCLNIPEFRFEIPFALTPFMD